MLIALLTALALSGNPEVTADGPDGRGVSAPGDGLLVVQAEVPVEVAVDSRPVAQVFSRSTLHIPARVGERQVVIYVGGTPHKMRVDVPAQGAAHVVVGRTGITTRIDAPADVADVARVELRVVGDEGLRLTLGQQRYRLSPGEQQALELDRGVHDLEIRSGDGLAVYATGDLLVRGTGTVVVQLSAGRAPEVIGRTGSWQPAVR